MQTASPEMHKMLSDLRERIVVGIVGGSDLPKQKEQVGDNVINEVDYSFSENGLVAYKQGELIGKEVYHIPLDSLNKFFPYISFK